MGYEGIDPYKKPHLAYRIDLNMPFLWSRWSDCGNLPPPRLWLKGRHDDKKENPQS
jgi:hypothetical protein